MSMATATTSSVGSASVQGELWGARARDYAEVQEPTFRPLYESVLARPEIATVGSILDVGCGPGLASQVFSGKICHVAGVDATAPFVEIARRRVPGGDFRVGEMEALPYADGSFDAVTSFNAFQYAASPMNALREASRVVKPGGIVVIAVWGLPESCEAAGHLKALGSLMPPPPPGAPGPFALSDETKLKGLAREARLIPGVLVDVPCPWVYPDLETALRGMLSAGPAERAARASSFGRARDAVTAAIEIYRSGSGDYRLNNTFRYLVTSS
jgi:SAM-dependent methyltransferase